MGVCGCVGVCERERERAWCERMRCEREKANRRGVSGRGGRGEQRFRVNPGPAMDRPNLTSANWVYKIIELIFNPESLTQCYLGF